MKLFHLDKDTENIIQRFIPRIPDADCRMEGEDSIVSRICVSTSIDGCLSAVPWQCSIEYFADEELPVRVYEFEITDESILDYKYLYENGLVNDANITKEHWILESIVPTKIYDIIMEECWYETVGIIPYAHINEKNYFDYCSGKEYTLSKYRIDRVIK